MPDSRWIMTQTWHDLLFAHWRVDARLLAAKVPASLPLDTFDGGAWLAIVAFHMSNVAPRGTPALPWISAFPELNVRTYVVRDGKPGVYFFSLDATNPIAVRVARRFFKLPYFLAGIDVQREGTVRYHSRRREKRRPAEEFTASYAPSGPVFEPRKGTLEYFLVERYCLYTCDANGTPWRLDIHHPPWKLQTARADIGLNTMTMRLGIDVSNDPALVHFAERQDMVAWPIRRDTP